jgi:hypothetical protein
MHWSRRRTERFDRQSGKRWAPPGQSWGKTGVAARENDIPPIAAPA